MPALNEAAGADASDVPRDTTQKKPLDSERQVERGRLREAILGSNLIVAAAQPIVGSRSKRGRGIPGGIHQPGGLSSAGPICRPIQFSSASVFTFV